MDHESRLSVVENQVNRLTNAVDTIADAIVTLARIEERQADMAETVKRTYNKLEAQDAKLDDTITRVSVIEQRLKPLEEVRTWVIVGLLSTVGLVGSFAWRFIFT